MKLLFTIYKAIKTIVECVFQSFYFGVFILQLLFISLQMKKTEIIKITMAAITEGNIRRDMLTICQLFDLLSKNIIELN